MCFKKWSNVVITRKGLNRGYSKKKQGFRDRRFGEIVFFSPPGCKDNLKSFSVKFSLLVHARLCSNHARFVNISLIIQQNSCFTL